MSILSNETNPVEAGTKKPTLATRMNNEHTNLDISIAPCLWLKALHNLEQQYKIQCSTDQQLITKLNSHCYAILMLGTPLTTPVNINPCYVFKYLNVSSLYALLTFQQLWRKNKSNTTSTSKHKTLKNKPTETLTTSIPVQGFWTHESSRDAQDEQTLKRCVITISLLIILCIYDSNQSQHLFIHSSSYTSVVFLHQINVVWYCIGVAVRTFVVVWYDRLV